MRFKNKINISDDLKVFKEKKNVTTIIPPIMKTGLSFLVYLQVIP